MNRRHFLRASAGLTLGGIALVGAGCAGSAPAAQGSGNTARRAASGRRKLDRVGIQLYTVRSLLQNDFEGTLSKVAGLGYKEFEFAGYYDRSPEAVRKLLDTLGVTAPSAHIGYDQVRDNLAKVIETSKVIGHTYIIVPSLPGDARKSIDSYKTVADVLNRSAERARMAGLQVAYHNHAFEFEPIDGQLPYDVLLRNTDPNLVKMEADLFWMMKAGVKPLDYFAKHPGRFALVHVKDMTAAGEMAPVGEGTTNFPEIFAQSEKAGIRHYVVEHDNPTDAMASIATSIKTLRELTY